LEASRQTRTGRDGLWSAFVAALLLACYVRTLLPGAGLGDSAELQTCAARLAIPHAPGYPLQVLTAHAFERLFPFGTPAWRASLYCALCMTGAALVVLRLLRAAGLSAAAASGIALAFGLALPVWSQATAAEVYALQLLLLAASLQAWLGWRAAPTRARLAWALVSTALSVTHHPLCAFALPGFAVLAWRDDGWAGFARRALALLGVGVACSAALYGWLAWRWHASDLAYSAMRIDSVARFAYEASGGQFRQRMFGVTYEQLVEQRLPAMLAVYGRALLWLAPLALAGWLLPARRGLRAALLLLALLPSVYAATYRIDDIEPYFLPTLLALLVSAGIALAWCELHLRSGRWLAPAAALALACVALCANGARADRGEEARYEAQARALLTEVDRDALLVWPEAPRSQLLWYLLLVEGYTERNIHLVHDRDLKALRRYVAVGAPLYERHTRHWIPAGLAPYVLDAAAAELLRARGFSLQRDGERLWRVTGAPTAASETPAARVGEPTR
jgi:hypothetical protein